MGTKGWIIFATVAVLVLGGLILLSGRGKIDVSEFNTHAVIKANEKSGNIGDHVFGKGDGKVTFIEFGDFQCNPGCRLFHENFSPIMKDDHYKDKITFVFRNFPISSIHPNAMAAAATAEAAGLQGKYWEMWDMLYANQSRWSSASSSDRSSLFESYAKDIGLDIEKFKTDISSSAVSQKIKFDKAVASSLNVSGTPTVFLNGKLVDNSDIQSTEKIKALLDKAIGDK